MVVRPLLRYMHSQVQPRSFNGQESLGRIRMGAVLPPNTIETILPRMNTPTKHWMYWHRE